MKKRVLFALVFTALALPTVTSAQCPSDSRDLATHVSNQIDNRISGQDPSIVLSIYATRSSVPWIRKTDSWTERISPIDFTGVAGYNDDLSNHFGNGLMGGGDSNYAQALCDS